jgi:hypothetical protein
MKHACVACLLWSLPVAAQQPPSSISPPPFPEPSQPPPPVSFGSETGFAVGLRLGFALPFGKTTDDSGTGASDLTSAVRGSVPIGFAVGFRPIPLVYLGAMVQIGPDIVAQEATGPCPPASGLSCSSWDLVLGVELHLHLRPRARVDPWVGAGFGYEVFSFQTSANPSSSRLSGFALFSLDAGVDLVAWHGLRVGPFVRFTLGRFGSHDSDGVSETIENTALHEWLLFGLRAQFNL